MWKAVAILLLALGLLSACAEERSPSTTQAAGSAIVPPPPDLSFLATLDGTCQVASLPSVQLTAAEACWVEALVAECSPASDCLARCLTSGQGRLIGGGCWHACSFPTQHFAGWREPAAAERCRALGRVNGT